MALTPEEKRRAVEFMHSLPGKRGIDIPADLWDRIHAVANGITRPLWGRGPSPEQLDWLHKTGAHTPDAIHAAFSALPHPHAPQTTVGEYQKYAHGYELYHEHRGGGRR